MVTLFVFIRSATNRYRPFEFTWPKTWKYVGYGDATLKFDFTDNVWQKLNYYYTGVNEFCGSEEYEALMRVQLTQFYDSAIEYGACAAYIIVNSYVEGMEKNWIVG